MIEVPNFVNSSYDMVAQNPVQNSRFKINAVLEFSDEVEKGYIISQSLEAGTSVETGSEITFVVSKGREFVTIPPVKDTNIDYAKQTLEQAGFVVNIITKENNGDYTEGLVAEITPAEGTSKTKGTDVFVQVWGAPPSTEPDTETTTEKILSIIHSSKQKNKGYRKNLYPFSFVFFIHCLYSAAGKCKVNKWINRNMVSSVSEG